MFCLSLGVSTVDTNWDRDFSICQDQLLKPVEIIHRVKTRIFYFLVEIFKIETFQLRLICVEIFIVIVKKFKTYQDFWDLSRLFEISLFCQDFLNFICNKSLNFPHFLPILKLILKQKSKKNLDREIHKNLKSLDLSQQISIENYWLVYCCRDKIEISQSWLSYLDRQDQLFESVKIFSTVKTYFLPVSRLRVLIETTSRQIETPRLSFVILWVEGVHEVYGDSLG